jgi:hypothetical protein
VGGERRDDERAHDDCPLHERAQARHHGYRKGIILYRLPEFLSSRLNQVLPPPPPACECVLPPHLGPGGTDSLGGEGERGPNPDDWTETLETHR